MTRFLWVLPMLFVAVTSAAPTFPPQAAVALSSFLKSATDRGDVPGVAVVVVNKDGTLYDEAFGLSSTLARKAMTKDTIFSIASMTKPITSVAIMMLVDEGKLTLDDDVGKYLPKYKDPVVISKFNEADGSYETRAAKQPITIRHLLTHTSGFAYGLASPMLTKIMAKDRKSEPDLPLLFDPGESWAYGPSTRVLGQVVEAISGQKLDAFFDARIFGPLGMRDTSYLVAVEKYPRLVSINARGKDGNLVESPMTTPPVNIAGDGGLYGTASDYGLFLRMLLNRGTLNGKRVLSEKSVDAMLQPQTGNVVVKEQQSTNLTLAKNFPLGAGKDKWGLGFQLAAEQLPNHRSAGSGTWVGIFNTYFFIDPHKELGVVVMMQVLPFYDQAAMSVYEGVEEAVYKNVK
jgi:methyl acetate hydrolase